jgi:hypothetical protein
LADFILSQSSVSVFSFRLSVGRRGDN